MTRQLFMMGFLTLALAVSAPIPVLAADGDLDPTFGVGGRVRYEDEDSSGSSLYSNASAI